MFKFDDETYQAKLRSAINTDLNHDEVTTLQRASTVFLLLVIGLAVFQTLMENNSVSKVDHYVQQVGNRATEYAWLTSNLMAALDPTTNITSIMAANANR